MNYFKSACEKADDKMFNDCVNIYIYIYIYIYIKNYEDKSGVKGGVKCQRRKPDV